MAKSRQLEIFDTTLRDGSQGEDVSLSVEDKLAIAVKLDELGVHWIEGGWPAPSNLKDREFFRRAARLRLKSAGLVAFGSTTKVGVKAAQDPLLKSLLEAGTAYACIFGKSSVLHVEKVLRTTKAENLRMIGDSVSFLRRRMKKVFYDAEHFFDGYKLNKPYAMAAIKAAYEGGADCLVLCDTNGGCLPSEISRITAEVAAAFPKARLGIHAHNDGELAVANSLAAVEAGATQVQGCVNGLGERCGNANLVSLIPDLTLKLGHKTIPAARLRKLTQAARAISSIANIPLSDHQPYVGLSAFAHKSGVHVDAVMKVSHSYEHVPPGAVGNARRFLASEQAGKATMAAKAELFGVKLDGGDHARDLIAKVKELELQGYQFEGADASLELLMRRHAGHKGGYFELESYHISVERRQELEPAEATVKIRVRGKPQHTVAEGNGPVNALDQVLREALAPSYPALKATKLIDYKVRVLQSSGGTGAKVRVLMATTDGTRTWNTVGVHENIIEASWEALVDSIEYKLLKDGVKP